jgi:tetratricopeptide (TPR) repeat protein
MLWISGASGTGKSVLAAHVVRHLVDFNPRQPSVTAFYFFDRSVRLQRPLEALVAAILSQLVHQTEELDSTLVRAYETSLRFGRSRLSHLDDPLSLMKSMAVRAPRLDIVLDGLDECDDPGEILTAITELLQDVTNVHAIVLSRNIPRVGIHLGTVSNIPLDTVEHRRDIECFVHQSVAKLMLNDSKLEEQVASVVKENADGMFLWAVRVMESLHAATNPSEVLDLLKRLPPNINTYYDLHLQSLTQEHIHRRRLGMTVLRWMCCVVRPLSWAELQCSLALNEMRTQPDAMQTPFQSVVLEVCTPFVALDAVSKTIRLQHHSAREFLLQKPRSSDANSFFVDETETHHDLAEICLRQLLAQPPQSEFTQYATLFWLDHVLRATCTIQLRELVLKLVCDDANFERWLLDRVRWDGQRAHSTHKIIGSLSELNIWMQSSPNTTQLQNINWTAPIVRALLGADEHGVHEKAWLGHFEKLMIVRDIARILTQSKMLDEGITWFEDALRKRQQTTHGTSSHWIMSALGILYDQKNEIQRSLDLHAHVLTLQEKMTGRESLETLWTVNEMGRVYRHLGDYAKAEEQHNRALTSLKKILPHEHSEVIWTLNTLARAYRKSGKLTEALALHLQAVAGQERVVGPTHPHPLWTRGDIGKCYFGLRRFGEAELSFRLALKGRITLLGEMHVDTLWTMAKLGCVLATTTTPPPQEAFELLARALEGQMVALGAQHTQTIKTAVVLRELESRSGRGLKACAVVAACTLSS